MTDAGAAAAVRAKIKVGDYWSQGRVPLWRALPTVCASCGIEIERGAECYRHARTNRRIHADCPVPA